MWEKYAVEVLGMNGAEVLGMCAEAKWEMNVGEM